MPSGAKKRKAAKKKMVKEANNYTTATHSHGDDEPKHHDEKESDGGEVSSPASQDHHNHQRPFTVREEEEVEKREGNSSVQSFASENKSTEGESMQKEVEDEVGIVQIDKEMKSEDDFEGKNLTIESAKESHDGSSSGSSSSSSSSSDDESHDIKKKTVVLETAPAVDLVKLVDSSKKVTPVNDDLIVETAPVVDLVKPIDSLSQVVPQVNYSILVEEANNLVAEIHSVADSVNVSVIEQTVHIDESASADNSITSGVVDSVLKENGEKNLPSLDENTGVSSVLVDFRSQKKNDEVVSTSNEDMASSERMDYAASVDAKDSVVQENEDKLLLSFNVPRADTIYGAVHVKESETPKCSDSQPLVASAALTAQKTSWKSCCGIFELLTGSDR